jgi:hypothetical protein
MRTVEVNADALGRLLMKADRGGFLSAELGVAWEDDGSGFARKLVRSGSSPEDAEELTVWVCGCGKDLNEPPAGMMICGRCKKALRPIQYAPVPFVVSSQPLPDDVARAALRAAEEDTDG